MTGEESTEGTKWMIHRFECPDCDSISRADRAVKCYRCGSEMNRAEKVGEIYITENDQ